MYIVGLNAVKNSVTCILLSTNHLWSGVIVSNWGECKIYDFFVEKNNNYIGFINCIINFLIYAYSCVKKLIKLQYWYYFHLYLHSSQLLLTIAAASSYYYAFMCTKLIIVIDLIIVNLEVWISLRETAVVVISDTYSFTFEHIKQWI